MRRAVLGTALLLAAACGSDLLRSRRPADCSTPRQIVHDYLQRLASRASNRARTDVLERGEIVYVSFAVGADGSASDFRVERAKRAEAAQEVLRAAAAASPYPAPPFDPQACLADGRAISSMVGHGRCDEALANAYTDAAAARIQDAVRKAEITADVRERVALRMRVDRQGVPAIHVNDAEPSEAAGRVVAVARSLAPFDILPIRSRIASRISRSSSGSRCRG